MSVLVLSEDFDPTTDRVIDILNSRDVSVFRADTAWFPHRLALHAELDGEGWDGFLFTAQRKLKLADVHSIWYRRPTSFQFPDEMSEPERQHASWEAQLGLGGVLSSLPALWVNHPGKEADIAYKPRQLFVARRCGLTVPRTLITNNPTAVKDFRHRLGPDVIVKPLSFCYIGEQGQLKPIYTHLLSAADVQDLAGVGTTAHLFQEFVPKAYEARVTVVGRHTYAAAIHGSSPASRVDWRSDYDALTYRVIDVPAAVTDGMGRFMDEFDLQFSAFDFVVTPDNRWVFLEANAGGQFGWIEAHTGLPIASALAGLLENGAP